MNLILITLAMALLASPAYAFADATSHSQPMRIDQELRLTKREISVQKELAQGGDNAAAVKLARYFDFYVRDYDSAKFWFEKAARNGDVQSQYNLGVRLMTKRKDAGSCREAQAWFNMALTNGLLKAQKALDELGQCPEFQKLEINTIAE